MDYELSYLIRMGAGKHPQCFGMAWELEEGEIVRTCAIGAAVRALLSLSGNEYNAFDAVRDLPVCLEIIRWNDKERLTREVIADRLDAMPHGSPLVHVP